MASNWLHSVCIWPCFRYFTIRVYTQVIWNVCPYKYLQLDKAEQILLVIYCCFFCFFLIPRQTIPFCSSLRLDSLCSAAEGNGNWGWSSGLMVASFARWLDLLYGPHTLWLTVAVCVLMEACGTETRMAFSACALLGPVDNEPEVDGFAVSSDWSIGFTCRLELQLYKHYFLSYDWTS